MSYTDQEIEAAIAAVADRTQNKAVTVRQALSMLRVNLATLAVPAGAKFLFGAGQPASALGDAGDVYDNTLTGDRYSKQPDGTWLFQYRAKGEAGVTPVKGRDYTDGYTPVKGRDYTDGRDGESTYQLWLKQGNTGSEAVFLASLKGGRDGEDGADGSIWHLESFDPANPDGNDGDFWQTTVSLSSEKRFKKIGGAWRKFYDNTGAGTTAPSTLAVALAIGVASVVAGNPVTFNVTATGGATPYIYTVEATNTATGAKNVLGVTASGSWTPSTPGTYDIAATVTDAVSASRTSVTRTLTVTQAANILPVANAGTDLTINLPTNSVQLTGTGTDADGTIVGWQWAQVAGPNIAVMATPNLANTTVSNLVAGTYRFQLTVQDDRNGTKSDDVLVIVNAQPVPIITSVSPASGAVGSSCLVTGSGFGSPQGNSTLTVNGVLVTNVASWSDTNVRFTIPAGASTGKITLTTSAGTATSAANFTVTVGRVRKVGIPVGQSNDSSLGPQKDFPAKYRAASALVDTWNDDTEQVEALQMGVNEGGLNGNAGYPAPPNGYPYTRSDGVTIPLALAGYYDGAGMEMQYSQRHDADHALANGGDGARFLIFKQNVNHPTNTNGATVARWQNEIFADFKAQWQRFVAWCAAQGDTVEVVWISFGVKESEGGNTNFPAAAHALLNRFETEGITTPATMRLIPRAPQIASQDVAGYQDQLVATYPNQYKMYRNASTTYLTDNVHFDTPSQIVWGDKLYDVANNVQAPPPPPGGPLELGYLQYQHGLLTAAGATTNSTNAFMIGCAVRLDYLDSIEISAFNTLFFQGVNGNGSEGLTCNIDKNAISFRYQKASGDFDFFNISRANFVSQGVKVGIVASFDGQTLKVAIGSSVIQTRAIGQALKGAGQPTAWGALQFMNDSGATVTGYGMEGGLQNIFQFNRAAASDAELSAIAAAGCQLTSQQATETACVVYGVTAVNDQEAISFDNLAKPANPITISRFA